MDIVDEMNPNELNSIVFVVTGDLFHEDSESIDGHSRLVFLNFWKAITKKCILIIIPGNHDYKVGPEDEKNQATFAQSIRSIVGESDLPDFSKRVLVLSEKGGVYQIRNLLISHVPIGGDVSKSISDLESSLNRVIVDHRSTWGQFHSSVAVYHGYVDRTSSEATHPREFSKFDQVLLGDIHKHRMVQNRIGYAGSLTQQNLGEAVDDQGFILWSVLDKKAKFSKVTASIAHFNIPMRDSELTETNYKSVKEVIRCIQTCRAHQFDGAKTNVWGLKTLVETCLNSIPLHPEAALKVAQTRFCLHLRVEMYSQIFNLKMIMDQIHDLLCTSLTLKRDSGQALYIDTTDAVSLVGPISVIVNCHKADELSSLLSDDVDVKSEFRFAPLGTRSNQISISSNVRDYLSKAPDEIKEEIEKWKISHLLNTQLGDPPGGPQTKPPRTILQTAEWQNFLSYKTRQQLHFDQIFNECVSVVGITGPNASGKSSLLYMLVFGMYGCIPDRTLQKRDIAILVSRVKLERTSGNPLSSYDNHKCFVRLTCSLGDDRYQVYREVTPKGKQVLKIHKNSRVVAPDLHDSTIDRLFGPFDISMISTFSMHSHHGGWMNCKPDERYSKFLEIIGMADMDKWRESVVMASNKLKTERRQLKSYPRILSALKCKIEDNKASIVALVREIAEMEERKRSLVESIAKRDRESDETGKAYRQLCLKLEASQLEKNLILEKLRQSTLSLSSVNRSRREEILRLVGKGSQSDIENFQREMIISKVSSFGKAEIVSMAKRYASIVERLDRGSESPMEFCAQAIRIVDLEVETIRGESNGSDRLERHELEPTVTEMLVRTDRSTRGSSVQSLPRKDLYKIPLLQLTRRTLKRFEQDRREKMVSLQNELRGELRRLERSSGFLSKEIDLLIEGHFKGGDVAVELSDDLWAFVDGWRNPEVDVGGDSAEVRKDDPCGKSFSRLSRHLGKLGRDTSTDLMDSSGESFDVFSEILRDILSWQRLWLERITEEVKRSVVVLSEKRGDVDTALSEENVEPSLSIKSTKRQYDDIKSAMEGQAGALTPAVAVGRKRPREARSEEPEPEAISPVDDRERYDAMAILEEPLDIDHCQRCRSVHAKKMKLDPALLGEIVRRWEERNHPVGHVLLQFDSLESERRLGERRKTLAILLKIDDMVSVLTGLMKSVLRYRGSVATKSVGVREYYSFLGSQFDESGIEARIEISEVLSLLDEEIERLVVATETEKRRALLANFKDWMTRTVEDIREIDRFKSDQKDTRESLKKIEGAITELRSEISKREGERGEIEASRSKFTLRLHGLDVQMATKSGRLATKRESEARFAEEEKEIEKKLDNMFRLNRRIDVIDKWLQSWYETMGALETDFVNHFEREINHIIGQVSKELRVKIDRIKKTKKSKVGLVIEPIHSSNAKLLSGFESRMISMACRSSIQRIMQSSCNFEFLCIDEGFTSFDRDHVGRLKQTFDYIRYFNVPTLIISHNPTIMSFCDRLIHVNKTDESRIRVS